MEEDEQKQLEQEQFRNMTFRMYENEYPNKNDVVLVSSQIIIQIIIFQCKITKLTESGAYVDLLEYLKKGLLFSSEITLKRINYINRVLSVGKEEVLQVLNVDKVKGFIDLSKKQVKSDQVEKCKLRYAKSKQVENIVKILAVHTKNSMETIYKKVIWPLYKTHEHALDALKEILNGNEAILNGLKANDEIKKELMNILKERLVPQPVKIKADFKLTCYTFDGIEAIKEALLNGEKKGTKKIPIKFSIIGAPLYECSLITVNKKEGLEIMNQALEEIKRSIKARNGNYLLETNPQILGEGEKSLREQLNEARNKEDISEGSEENEDENEEGIKANLPKFGDEEFKIRKTKK